MNQKLGNIESLPGANNDNLPERTTGGTENLRQDVDLDVLLSVSEDITLFEEVLKFSPEVINPFMKYYQIESSRFFK